MKNEKQKESAQYCYLAKYNRIIDTNCYDDRFGWDTNRFDRSSKAPL